MDFLNISKSIFDRMKIRPIKMDGVRGLYSRDDILNKIQNGIDIYKQCEFVPDFPNYLVNKNGEIYSIKGKVVPYKLKYKIDKYGYQIVALSNENGKKHIGVHRVVAITFLDNPMDLPEVNHKDGDKTNNTVDNLEWCTTKFNINHAFDNKLNKTGIDNWKSSPVIAYRNNNEIDGIYENILDCSRYYNIDENTVRSSDKNKTTKGRCGFYFRRISKEEFYRLKGDENYQQKIITYKNSKRCTRINQYTA